MHLPCLKNVSHTIGPIVIVYNNDEHLYKNVLVTRQFSLIYSFFHSVCDIGIYNIDCAVMHPKGDKNLVKKGPKTHTIQDGGMFTCEFKMAAIFEKLYSWIPSI